MKYQGIAHLRYSNTSEQSQGFPTPDLETKFYLPIQLIWQLKTTERVEIRTMNSNNLERYLAIIHPQWLESNQRHGKNCNPIERGFGWFCWHEKSPSWCTSRWKSRGRPREGVECSSCWVGRQKGANQQQTQEAICVHSGDRCKKHETQLVNNLSGSE